MKRASARIDYRRVSDPSSPDLARGHGWTCATCWIGEITMAGRSRLRCVRALYPLGEGHYLYPVRNFVVSVGSQCPHSMVQLKKNPERKRGGESHTWRPRSEGSDVHHDKLHAENRQEYDKPDQRRKADEPEFLLASDGKIASRMIGGRAMIMDW